MFKLISLIAIAVLLVGCTTQAQVTPSPSPEVKELNAEKGDLVAVDYVGTLDNGTVFDTSIKAEAQKAGLPLRPSYEPLEFTIGAGEMIKGFDNGVIGMKIGETKTVKMKPADAYGEKRQDLIIDIEISQFGDNPPKVGDKLQSSNGMVATVVNATNATITIDANHALAGQNLNFKITMRNITR